MLPGGHVSPDDCRGLHAYNAFVRASLQLFLDKSTLYLRGELRRHGALLCNEVRRACLHELNHIVHEPIYREDALGI